MEISELFKRTKDFPVPAPRTHKKTHGSHALHGTREKYISPQEARESALQTFARMLTDEDSNQGTIGHIQSMVKKSGAGYEILDPTGKKNATEMKEEFDNRSKAVLIRMAIKHFKKLDNENYLCTAVIVSSMEDLLKDAGVGYEALDPKGKTTDEKMGSVLEEKLCQSRIRYARNRFEVLHKVDNPEKTAEEIGRLLKEAGVQYDVLDPTGKKTAEQMKMVADERAAARRPCKEKSWMSMWDFSKPRRLDI